MESPLMRTKGSWRDFLDPPSPAESCNSSDFEPFSEDELTDMDLTLFEPRDDDHDDAEMEGECWDDECSLCCQFCARFPLPPPNIYILSGFDKEIGPGTRINDVAWEPYFCVLLQDEQTLTAYRSEDLALFPGTYFGLRNRMKIGDALFVELPRVRLDGGAKAFRQRWGYDGGAPAAPPLLEEDEEEQEGETVSLREEVMPPSSPLVCASDVDYT
ncbi:uncharacterized protein LOC142328370 [Lycorma delicatula]|uniref:uncharacterized protein LOC142328370 n=1 Tax=Lycorma delicatula TaxID=130591 RepID=UPI003F50E3F7